jgi:hypothetical protein
MTCFLFPVDLPSPSMNEYFFPGEKPQPMDQR